jgi:hypothetical protein
MQYSVSAKLTPFLQLNMSCCTKGARLLTPSLDLNLRCYISTMNRHEINTIQNGGVKMGVIWKIIYNNYYITTSWKVNILNLLIFTLLTIYSSSYRKQMYLE